MSLIDTSYFVGEITIAQIAQPGVDDVVPLFISKYEGEFLNKALGYSFAKLFTDGLATEPVESKWTNLRDGADYKDSQGYTKHWYGFRDDVNKISIIANYVYFFYTRNKVSYSGSFGETIPVSENGKGTSSISKLARTWNEMSNAVKVLHDFLLNAKDDNGNLIYSDFDIYQVETFGRINPVFGL